eukprot:COSAG01_NODE_8809_length_2652_cov_1.596161_2_plen_84_part_00
MPCYPDRVGVQGMVEGLVLRTINDINVTDLVEDELAYSDEPLHGSGVATICCLLTGSSASSASAVGAPRFLPLSWGAGVGPQC